MQDPLVTRQCQCGYIHPPPWDKDCPIVSQKTKSSDEKGIKIQKICTELSNFLHERSDYEKMIEGIDIFIKKMRRG